LILIFYKIKIITLTKEKKMQSVNKENHSKNTADNDFSNVIETYLMRLLFFLIMLCFYGMLIQPHYATDSYSVYFDSDNGALFSARYVAFLFIKILALFKINVIKTQSIWTFLSIFVASQAVYETVVAVSRFIKLKSKTIIVAISTAALLMTINIYILEWFLFPESVFPFILGMYITIRGALVWKEVDIRECILSFICVSIGLCCYQINIGFYVILSAVVIAIKNNDNLNKKSFFQTLKMLFIAGLAGIINIVFQKAINITLNLKLERMASFSIEQFINNVIDILSQQDDIWVTGSHLMKYSMILFLVCLLFFFIITSVKLKLNKNMYNFLLIIGSYVTCFIFSAVTYYVWLSPRTIACIFTFLSALSILVIDIMNEHNMNKSIKVFSVILILFLISNYYTGQKIIIDHFINNKMDQHYALEIYDEIVSYENKSGNTVTTIYVGADSELMWVNKEVEKKAYNVNERAYLNIWSDVNLINFVSGRQFIRKDMPEEFKREHFADKNWDEFLPQEQLYFENNILYWVKY